MRSGSAERIRVGVVGASPETWASGVHLPVLAALAEFELTAVATTNVASASKTASAFGVRHAFGDAAELVAHPDVDLVVVSVKSSAHDEVIRAALAAGKHVLSEWPLAANLTEATELASAATAAGVVHMIGLQGYHLPEARFVRDLLADGRIGTVESAGVVVAGDPLGSSRVLPSMTWTTDPSAGTSLLTIMAGHTVGTLAGLVGELTDVSALIAGHDKVTVAGTDQTIANRSPGQVTLHGRLDGGGIASVTVQGGNAPGPDGFFIRISGTEGALTITAAEPGGYQNWGGWRIQITGADGTTEHPSVPARYNTVPPEIPAGPQASVAAGYLEIAQAIKEGRPAHPGFDTAVRHHRLLDAIEQASASGTRHPLP